MATSENISSAAATVKRETRMLNTCIFRTVIGAALVTTVSSATAIAAASATSTSSSVAGAISSPNAVTGTVRLSNGLPAAGAHVSLRFGSSTTTAGGSGQYTLDGIDGGFATVDATFVSGGVTFTGSAWVSFPPGGGATANADITVRAFPVGPFPPFPPLAPIGDQVIPWPMVSPIGDMIMP